MQVTPETMIEEIKRIAKKLRKNKLSISEFCSNSKISRWQIFHLFDGWNDAVKKAGLTRHDEKEKIDKSDLFIEMERVFLKFDSICNRTKFDKLCKYSVDVYKNRFGRWSNILQAFRNWLEENNKEFPFMDQFQKSPDQSLISTEILEKGDAKKVTSWDTTGGTKYGSVINFRGLLHAPLNEQGVVFLFGMICKDLSIIVELIRTEYPDCEAMRLIDKNHDQWERIKIEFEFRSINFMKHNHDPKGCDLIVCWIHDWKECPLEVIELKSKIKDISE